MLYLDSAGNITGGLDAPWAKDAVGGTVATSYTNNASAVTQHVAFTDDTAFPVVADPSGWWGWAKCTASVGAFVAGNLLAACEIARLGGLAKVSKILKQARNAQERYKSLLYFFGEFAGINSILTNSK